MNELKELKKELKNSVNELKTLKKINKTIDRFFEKKLIISLRK